MTWQGLNPPYSTIVADPPWPTSARGGVGGRRRNVTHIGYSTLSLEAIAALSVAELVGGDASLWLWVTAGLNRRGAGVRVAEAWGFEVVGEFVWAKSNFGLGAFPRPQHEILLVCRKGAVKFDRSDVGSVQRWSQTYGSNNGGKVHSAKPPAALDLVESVCPGPYLELFARNQRLGWDSWGYGYEEQAI